MTIGATSDLLGLHFNFFRIGNHNYFIHHCMVSGGKMKPANERKQQIFWCDIYPNMERKIMCLFATAPQNKPTYPNKRLWVTIEIPGDAELWPEIFDGKNIDVKKISIENP